MNGRVFAVLFTVIFVIGAVPVLMMHPIGPVSAWLTVGFMRPIEKSYHAALFVAIGIFAACLGAEALALIPLSALLMLTIGMIMQVDPHQFPGISGFILAAILLFALSVSMLRKNMLLLCVPPIAAWAYYVGAAYMQSLPDDSAPLYFLQGVLVSASLAVAIGICLGVTLSETIYASLEKLKHVPAVLTFLSLF